jgi:ABC-type polysaccharide/polyol phosphate transport system ATPase subunit
MLPDGSVVASSIWKRFRADRHRKRLVDQAARLRQMRRVSAEDRYRWALRDVDLHVEPGGSVALVGLNGSGKSTLLKLLTRVMYPYAGSIEVRGRVGALVEVRAGIHPDLTGRENVFLYGSLLGLSRKAVAQRFDEIVAFAELDEAVDRQVKFYSSGMHMRLGFSVAAFLEPDVLLVDEVLSVGDSAFQQRCLDRMRLVLEQGTTLVFVSHDLPAVEATCARGVWLDRGTVALEGEIRDVLSAYRNSIEQAAEATPRLDGPIRVLKCAAAGEEGAQPRTQEPLLIELRLGLEQEQSGNLVIGISEGQATPIFLLRRALAMQAGDVDVHCRIEHLPLPRGRYFLWFGVLDRKSGDLVPWHPAASFDVAGSDLDKAPRGIVRLSPVHVACDWTVEQG